MSDPASPGLFRRLGTILYDTVLLVALELVVAQPLPLVPEHILQSQLGRACTFAGMLLVAYLFFGWFWTHGGQTLGMRAWRVRVVRNDGTAMTWWDSLKRLVAATASLVFGGIGFLWCLVDKNGDALHDRRCGSKAQYLPKPSGSPQDASGDAS